MAASLSINKNVGHIRRDGFHVDFNMFFDRPGVMRRVNKKKERILARTGNMGRTVMRTELNRKWTKRKGASKPPRPPLKREGQIYNTVVFGFAGGGVGAGFDSVVIGPTAFSAAGVTTPQLLNEGGTRVQTLPSGKRVMATYLPRPFASRDTPAYTRALEVFHTATAETDL